MTQAPAKIAPGNIINSEKSILENDPRFRWIFPYQTWVSGNVRRSAKEMGVVNKNLKRLLESPKAADLDPQQEARMLGASISKALKHQTSIAAAGVAGSLALAWVKDGQAGLTAEWGENKFMKTLRDSEEKSKGKKKTKKSKKEPVTS